MWIPALGKLFHTGHIDAAIVQVVLDVGQVFHQEASVGADRVSTERDRSWIRDVLFDEGECCGSSFFQRGSRGSNGLEQARLGVHGYYDGVHGGEHVVRLMNDEVWAFRHDVQVVVGDEGGDFHDDVDGGIEPRHLQIHPNEHHPTLRRASYRRGVASSLVVPIRLLDADLPLPTKAHPHDAGLDLYARTDALVSAGGGRVLIPTGVAVAIPVGYMGMVVPRSGLALKHGISLVNTPGIIDAAYRGELQVIMINHDPTSDYQVRRGDRIAQLIVQAIAQVEWSPVSQLDDNDRGGGFGHSGR